MLYLVALILPPLAVLLAGKVITALLMLALWLVSLVLTFGVSHIIFVVLAWIIVASAKGDRRHNDMLRKRG